MDRAITASNTNQRKSVARLLKFVGSQPERHYEGWTRDDLYGYAGCARQ